MSVTQPKHLALAASALVIAGCGPSSEPVVSFGTDVKPLLDRYCLECHKTDTDGYAASGFSVETYADVMKGTRFGPTVIAGDAFNSNLMILIEGRASPAIAMPHDGTRVYTAHVETLRTWIDKGALDN